MPLELDRPHMVCVLLRECLHGSLCEGHTLIKIETIIKNNENNIIPTFIIRGKNIIIIIQIEKPPIVLFLYHSQKKNVPMYSDTR